MFRFNASKKKLGPLLWTTKMAIGEVKVCSVFDEDFIAQRYRFIQYPIFY